MLVEWHTVEGDVRFLVHLRGCRDGCASWSFYPILCARVRKGEGRCVQGIYCIYAECLRMNEWTMSPLRLVCARAMEFMCVGRP